MRNKNDHLRGSRVTAATPMRVLTRDFPGWGDPSYPDFIEDRPAGISGVISDVESHGSNPWTRFCIRWADGSSSNGVDPARVNVEGPA